MGQLRSKENFEISGEYLSRSNKISRENDMRDI